MSVVPQSATPAFPGRKWDPRLYMGRLSVASEFRDDLRRDLEELTGADEDLRETVVLCASEAFANSVFHSRSGRRGGTVMRLLSTPLVTGRETILRLAVIDDGPWDRRPMIPAQRSVSEWESAESGRGLLLIHHLATEWGTYRMLDLPGSTVLGTALWAEFAFRNCGATR